MKFEPHPDWSPLGFNSNFLISISDLFVRNSPSPPPPGKSVAQEHNKYLTVSDNNKKKTNLRGAVDDLRLGPSFHVLVFVHDPHSSFHVLFPHKTFVKRQVMAYSILLILLTSLYVSAKHIFLTQHWKYKRSSLRTRVLTGMETSTFFNQRTITVYTYFPRGRVSPEVSKLVNKPGVDLV